MMTLPTRDEAVAYIMAHGLQDLLSRAANACVKADAAETARQATRRVIVDIAFRERADVCVQLPSCKNCLGD